MPIELGESIKTFMTHGKNKVIESFTQHLFGDSWTWYFWTFYFQLGMWINFQSFIVLPPCCAYPKISTFWIKIKTPMIQATLRGYCVSCCRFVDGGVLMNATFKPGHISINWVLPWGIEMLVFFGNKRVLNSADSQQQLQNTTCTWLKWRNIGLLKTRLWNTLWRQALKRPYWSFTPMSPMG